MIVQGSGIATERDRVEVQRERLRCGEQQGCQAGDPTGQELLLVAPLGAIGVVGGEGRLGQDVQPGEETEGLVAVEVVDVAPPLFVRELQGQQAQEGTDGGDHARAGVARPLHQLVEA